MTKLRIINGNIDMLAARLGDLKDKLELKAGDSVLECETEENLLVGRAIFEKLLTQGYSAIELTEKGKTKQQLKEFNPQAASIIMFAPVVGG